MKILSKLDNTGMIEEVADKRFVTDAEKITWNSKSDTDTVTTINGKTGAIVKADIVALGIPAKDTTYSIATTSANGLMSSNDKQNLNTNTASRHTHINKTVIDKFSEVDNKPYYDGVEIGEAVPNLTLTELTLGNFKIVFNEVENSLDFEVI